jgi:hypothetical protein
LEIERTGYTVQIIPYWNVDQAAEEATEEDQDDYPGWDAKLYKGYGDHMEEHEYQEKGQEESKQDKQSHGYHDLSLSWRKPFWQAVELGYPRVSTGR